LIVLSLTILYVKKLLLFLFVIEKEILLKGNSFFIINKKL